jgi:hypothetical protein
METTRRGFMRAALAVAAAWVAGPAAAAVGRSAPVELQGARIVLPAVLSSCAPPVTLVALIAAPAGGLEPGAWDGFGFPGAKVERLSGEAALAAVGGADLLVVGAEGSDATAVALARRLCRESRAANHQSVLVVAREPADGADVALLPIALPGLLSRVRDVTLDLYEEHRAPGCPVRYAPPVCT